MESQLQYKIKIGPTDTSVIFSITLLYFNARHWGNQTGIYKPLEKEVEGHLDADFGSRKGSGREKGKYIFLFI